MQTIGKEKTTPHKKLTLSLIFNKMRLKKAP